MTPKTLACYNLLRREIGTAMASGKARLPTMAAMARRFGYSTSVVLKAVQQLKEEGYCTVKPGGGIRISGRGAIPDEKVSTPQAGGWRRVYASLKQQIESGVFPPGVALPSIKEMMARFGAQFRTVRKACDRLERDLAIVRSGRRYYIATAATGSPGKKIVVMGRYGSGEALLSYSVNAEEFWRSLERESVRIEAHISVMAVDQVLRMDEATLERSMGSVDTLGIIVLTLALDTNSIRCLASVLGGLRVPVAWFDELGTTIFPPWSMRYHRHLIVGFRGPDSAGMVVGEELYRKGHRRVACFDLFAGSVVHPRLLAIRRFFTERSSGARVDILVTDFNEYAEMDRRVATEAPFTEIDRCVKGIRRYAEKTTGIALEHDPFWVAGARFNHALLGRMLFEPLFERALGDRSITAWVAFNDLVGCLALDFLAARGIRTPRDIAVAGFDDTLQAFMRGLTSYSFNVRQAVRTIVEHLAQPSKACAGGDWRRTLVPGILMQRGSSAGSP